MELVDGEGLEQGATVVPAAGDSAGLGEVKVGSAVVVVREDVEMVVL
jgi:hypothetical protein